MTPRPDSTPGDPDTLGSLGPLADAMGIKLQEARPGRVVATMPVEGNTQPFGLLNGGASAVMAETLGSLAGMLSYDVRVTDDQGRPVCTAQLTGIVRPRA